MSEFKLPLNAIKGRGAATRLAHRFARDVREAFDDDWPTTDADNGAASAVPTQVIFEDVKSAIARNDSPDIDFDFSINPYRGCENGCSYCYARPTHSYLNLSPGLDFETKIIAKRNLAEVLRCELAAPRYRPRRLNLGSATDCYQPAERELRLTRAVIAVLQETRHPFSLITKGSGVERDLDLIAPMAAMGLAAVYVTVTTLDAQLSRRLEPRAAAPWRRLRTIRALADAGVPVGVSVAPQIPFLNTTWSRCSKPPGRPARAALSTPCCAFRGRWSRCFASGWNCTHLSAHSACWRGCARCATDTPTRPTSPPA